MTQLMAPNGRGKLKELFVAERFEDYKAQSLDMPEWTLTRRQVRQMIEPDEEVIEVQVSTPLSVFESRDRKGLYTKARAGLIHGVTGLGDPCEIPRIPEIGIDTTDMEPEESIQRVILKIEALGFMAKPAKD